MAQYRILVVESEPTMAALYGSIFRSHENEFACDLVNTGEAALQFLDHTKIDLLLLSWELPSMPALDVLALVRAKKATSQLPVVVVARNELAEQRLAAIRSGADHYQGKGFLVEELLARIRRLLQRRTAYWSWSSFNPFSWLSRRTMEVSQ